MPEGSTLEQTAARHERHRRLRRERFPKWRTTSSTSARRRPTTSTAWCATTSCGRAERRRHPGQPRAEGRARRAEPRHRETRPPARRPRSRSRFGARVKVAEVPPGPPVLQTLVAEVYGPDASDDRTRATGHGHLRDDRRGRRRRLVRRGRSAEVPLRRRSREGRAERRHAGADRRDAAHRRRRERGRPAARPKCEGGRADRRCGSRARERSSVDDLTELKRRRVPEAARAARRARARRARRPATRASTTRT